MRPFRVTTGLANPEKSGELETVNGWKVGNIGRENCII